MTKFSTLRSEEIARIIKSGRLYRSRSLLVFVEPVTQDSSVSEHDVAVSHDAPFGKVAFIAPKRLGSAVLRNRCKRLLRAGFREIMESGGFRTVRPNNVILMANAKTASKNSCEIGKEIRGVVPRIAKDQEETKLKDC